MVAKTTEFKITPTAIPGLLEIDINLIEDSRGYFQEKFQKDKLVALGLPAEFMPVQQNLTLNKLGATRGIHAEPWEKYVNLTTGKVLAVFVDLRGGQNFARQVRIELSPTKAVFIPQGVGNSFQTLEDNTYYSYLVNGHWSEVAMSKYLGVNLADPDLAIPWPISLDKAIVSDKDNGLPMLKDVKPI